MRAMCQSMTAFPFSPPSLHRAFEPPTPRLRNKTPPENQADIRSKLSAPSPRPSQPAPKAHESPTAPGLTCGWGSDSSEKVRGQTGGFQCTGDGGYYGICRELEAEFCINAKFSKL
ncbi:unnamed protein product [Lota lota]